MQKFLDAQQTDKPLQITSAMFSGLKGYIYVEAYKEAHVREATQGAYTPRAPSAPARPRSVCKRAPDVAGLNNLFYKIFQVPVEEMTGVMRMKGPQKKPLLRGTWARIKIKGDYKDDLAQVTHGHIRAVRRA